MRPGLVLAALGSTVNIAGAAGLIKHGDHIPASWCVTYLSTYLAPVSTRPSVPGLSDTSTAGIEPSLLPPISRNPPSVVLPEASSTEGQQFPDSSVTSAPLSSINSGTLLPTDVVSSDPVSTATTGPNPGGRSIIFQVVPSTDPERRDLSKRALGGYVGSGDTVNPDVCTDADTFSLTSGQLLDNDIPIFYDGEEFKLFGGQGPPPDDAITTMFQDVGGSLRWVNPSLPNGQAGFCQVAASGQVYITFSGQPDGCRPVTISIFTVEQCLKGELDARVPSDSTSGTTANPTVVSSSGVETSQFSASTDTVDSVGSSELPETLPGESTSSEASPDSLTVTTVPEDASSSIPQGQSTDDSPSAETSTDGNPPTSSGDDLSPTDAPVTTSSPSEPVSFDSSATNPSDTDPSTSEVATTDLSSTSIEFPSSTEPSSSLASTDFSLDSSTEPSFSATSSEASSTDSLPTTDGTTSSAPMTTEPSTTESLDSSSSETTVSTEPASSSSDSDATTSADTTTSPDTTTSEPTTTTSAGEEPTVLFSSDELGGHRGGFRTIKSDFQVWMYDSPSVYLTISVNGVIVLGEQVIDDSPHTNLPAQSLLYAVLPYWTENRIPFFSGQGITYRTLGTAPDRTLVIEFFVTSNINPLDSDPDHYTVTFFENRQRYCLVRYFRSYGEGFDATIGNQLYDPAPFNEFASGASGAIDDNSELGMMVEVNGQFTYNTF